MTDHLKMVEMRLVRCRTRESMLALEGWGGIMEMEGCRMLERSLLDVSLGLPPVLLSLSSSRTAGYGESGEGKK